MKAEAGAARKGRFMRMSVSNQLTYFLLFFSFFFATVFG